MSDLDTDWPAGPADPTLDARKVQVWHIPLDASADPQRRAVLSDAERERADRFHFERDRRRYNNAHAAVRIILARYVGGEAHSLRFDAEERGKPYLADHDLPFNLSHAGERALLAVGKDQPIGVDIEFARDDFDLLGIARRFFTGGEVARLETLSDPEQVALFYRIWTIKEAFLKGLGFGLHLSPERIDVSAGLEADVFELVHEGERWEGHVLPGFPSYAGAVAVRGSGWTITRYQYQPDG